MTRSLVTALLTIVVVQPLLAESEEPTEIKQLQNERVEVLESALEHVLAYYRNGRATYLNVRDQHFALLNAQLQLAQTHEEKKQLLEVQLGVAKSLLDLAESRAEAGLTDSLEALQAKASWLEIRIRLLQVREQGGSNRVSTPSPPRSGASSCCRTGSFRRSGRRFFQR